MVPMLGFRTRKIFIFALALLSLLACHVWLTLQQLEHGLQLAECRSDAEQANELTQQLLSRGRFVRRYDPKTGASVYTFRTR